MSISRQNLTVVIVSFMSENVIHDCIQSIPEDIKIIVVDNSNNYLFKERIEKKYSNTTCILSENVGMGSGNNLGLRHVLTDFAFILNPDVILKENTIDEIINASNILTSFGVIAPILDEKNFPNFKLALIKNQDTDQGQFQLWYYVKDRSNQDDYNWEFQAAGVGSSRYDSVVKTYVLLRSSYNESDPVINSAMPITSSDPFEGSDGYVLFEKKQVRSGDETLDSLYIVEQRTFVKKIPIRRVDIDETFDGDTFFPKVDYNKWDGKTIMNHTKDKENPHNFRVTVYEKTN